MQYLQPLSPSVDRLEGGDSKILEHPLFVVSGHMATQLILPGVVDRPLQGRRLTGLYIFGFRCLAVGLKRFVNDTGRFQDDFMYSGACVFDFKPYKAGRDRSLIHFDFVFGQFDVDYGRFAGLIAAGGHHQHDDRQQS
jgi:hypothetical protein